MSQARGDDGGRESSLEPARVMPSNNNALWAESAHIDACGLVSTSPLSHSRTSPRAERSRVERTEAMRNGARRSGALRSERGSE